MVLSRMVPALAVTGVLALAASAVAQPPGPRIPLDAKAYQATVIRQQYMRQQAAQRSARPAPVRTPVVAPETQPLIGPIELAITLPPPAPAAEPAPVLVDVRGPDGSVRSYALEGGKEAIQTPRVIVLRPGESATVRVTPAPATK